MPVREYAQALGVVLILLGVVEMVLGDRLLVGVLNIYIPKGMAHLLAGGLLIYLGFGQTDEGLARTAVVALGGVYLLVGLLGFVLSSYKYGMVGTVIHVLVGVVNLAVYVGSGRNPASRA